MKVVEVISSLKVGGAENMVVQILNGFSNRFERHIICFFPLDTPFSDMLEPDIHRHYIPFTRRGRLGIILNIVKLLKKIRPDIIQSHMYHTNYLSSIAAKIAGVPVIIATEHGKNHWKKRHHHFVERFIVDPIATKRVAVSEDIKNIRIDTKDSNIDKIVVIPPCADIPEKGVQYVQKQPLKIGAIGRMVSAKDYLTLLCAFNTLIKKKVAAELYFIGDGQEKEKLQNYVRSNNLDKVVFFPGFQSNVEVWLKGFDLVVFSSIREGTPVALLEAMSHGVAVVATKVGGIPDVIRNGREGLLVEQKNSKALSDAILQILCDVDLRAYLGKQGRKRVASLYSREVICRRYECLFEQLLNRVE